ncbi:MAG TPA: pyridoxal-phosphate dependent enzyme [Longimicrobiales bacterium]
MSNRPHAAREQPPALFRRYPEAAGRLPRVPLATLPTPVEPLALDTPAARNGAELWIKRDDRSGEPYGGNKVRKLEFLLAHAKAGGVTRLITAGAAGSHHALATTVYGRALGFDITLVLFPQPLTDHVRSVLLLDHALGADLRWTPRMELVPLALTRARRAHRAERVHVIAPGGSDPVGTLGYVSAALELADQVAAGEAPRPAAIHVAAGTLGTAAGLAIGCALAGLETRIHAARITSRLVTNGHALRRLITATVRLLHRAGVPAPAPEAALARVELRHDQIGAGYGHPTAAARAATETFAAAGIRLDPTYTAKAAADFLAAAAREPAGPRLFWHTLSAVEPEPRGDARPEQLPEPFRRYLERGPDRAAEPAAP